MAFCFLKKNLKRAAKSKELEEYQDRQSLIGQEKADIKMLLRK